MSDTTNIYPKWPGIVAIVAVSLAGAVIFFLAGFAAGRCSGGDRHMGPPPVVLAGGPAGGGASQWGLPSGGEHGKLHERAGNPQFGPERGEGPIPGRGAWGSDKDKKAEVAPNEQAAAPSAAKK